MCALYPGSTHDVEALLDEALEEADDHRNDAPTGRTTLGGGGGDGNATVNGAYSSAVYLGGGLAALSVLITAL